MKKKTKKKLYTKPEIKRIPLVPGEATLAACKTTHPCKLPGRPAQAAGS